MKKTASISARISPETKERLQVYAEATDQTSSQLLEKAINHYLDEIQNVTQNVGQDETHDVTQNVVQTETPDKTSLEKRLGALEAEVRQIKANNNVEAKKLNQLNKNAIKIPDMDGVSCALYQDELRDRVEALENAPNNETPTDLSIDGDSDPTKRSSESEEKPIPQLEDKIRQHTPIDESAIAPLNQTELAKRLNCSGEAIRKQRGKETFKEWSKKRDKSGIAWQYGEDKKYYPIL